MSTMLTLTVQLALATATLSPTAASPAGAIQPAHTRVVAQVQGWRGTPTPPPPAPPPPAPAPQVVQPRGVMHPTQAPPPPVVERFGRRRGWVWIGGNYE